jgi:serine protease AprX
VRVRWLVPALVIALTAPAGAGPSQPGEAGTVETRASDVRLQLVDRHGAPLDGRGTSIAVIDTGVDPQHPAFALPGGGNKVVRHVSVVPCVVQRPLDDGLSCVTDVPFDAPSDLGHGGHGTFVGGVAVGNPLTLADGTHVGGVAPGARLVMISATTALFGLEAAFAWVLKHHDHPCGTAVPAAICPPIRVMSMSWGANSAILAGLEQALVDVGVTTVWAAGNSGGDGSASATNPDPSSTTRAGVLSVASYDDTGRITRDGRVSAGSSRGASADPRTWPDLSAPGEGITSACRVYFAVCDAVGSGPRNGPSASDIATYWTGSGTSWAAPHVAGVIALLLQVRPTLSPAALDVLLKRTAHRYRDGAPYRRLGLSWSSLDKGAGLVDAYAAAISLGAHRRR